MIGAKRILSGASAGMFVSGIVHAALAGSLYYGLVLHSPAPIVAELDLSMAPLVPMAPNPGGGYGAKPAETWTLPKKDKAPAPQPAPAMETKEEVVKQENAVASCLEPCPQTATGTGGGGSGKGEGQYIPASQASRKPKWIKNFITPEDYPAVARQEGKDGRVVLSILLDSDGKVRDVRLLQGSYEALNEVALRKVKGAVFTPAYNEDNKTVSCKMTLPIRFELR